MARYEAGKWPAYNVNYIVRNVQSVFRNGNIRMLNKGAYDFIILHMGFIAHYSLGGFQQAYGGNLADFAKALQTSEYSQDVNYNLKQASRQETDRDFDKWYGEARNKSIAEAIRGIVAVARSYYQASGTMRNPSRRNVMPSMTFSHPNEYLVYSETATDFGVPTLQCPHCGRNVLKLFTLAHGGETGQIEAERKFTRASGSEVMCGLDLSSLLADNDVVVLGAASR